MEDEKEDKDKEKNEDNKSNEEKDKAMNPVQVSAKQMLEVLEVLKTPNASVKIDSTTKHIQELMDRLVPYSQSLMGSALHMRLERKKLLSMLQSPVLKANGTFRWFNTHTPNEMYDPCLYNNFIEEFLEKDGSLKWDRNRRKRFLVMHPALSARMHDLKQECIWNVLLGAHKPIGEIVDFWRRVEFQSGGSGHSHNLVVIALDELSNVNMETEDEEIIRMLKDTMNRIMTANLVPEPDPNINRTFVSTRKSASSSSSSSSSSSLSSSSSSATDINEEEIMSCLNAWEMTDDDALAEGIRQSLKQVRCTDDYNALEKRLKLSGQKVEVVAADGNCAFHAILKQLEHYAPDLLDTYPTHDALRRAAGNELKKGFYRDFLVTETIETSEEYIARMLQDREWADQPIIFACAQALNVCIRIFDSRTGQYSEILNEDAPRSLYLFYTGEQYYHY